MTNGIESKQQFLSERATNLIKSFERLAELPQRERKEGRNGVRGWRMLAVQEKSNFLANYPSSQTAASRVTDLKKIIDKNLKATLENPENIHGTKTVARHFGELMTTLFSEVKAAYNEEYRSRTYSRATEGNQVEVDFSESLQKASDTLKATLSNPTKSQLNWMDVSCALALTTGKRMVEIHSTGEFIVAGEYQISFKGQAKGKERRILSEAQRLQGMDISEGVLLKDFWFTLPTLVKAECVVSAVNWLERNGKRVEISDDDKAVNNLYSKSLSSRVKSDWCLIPDEVWQAQDARDKMTYHKFRGAFFLASMKNLGSSFNDILNLAPMLLGDADVKGLEPYRRLALKEGSLTKI